MLNRDPEHYKHLFESKDRMGALIGGIIISLSKDECLYRYEVRPEHYNPNGILHGGALYTAMDSSQGAFMHFTLDDTYKFAATGTATIRYHAPVTGGVINIRTSLTNQERRKFFVRSTATDEQGTEVATLDEVWIAVLK